MATGRRGRVVRRDGAFEEEVSGGSNRDTGGLRLHPGGGVVRASAWTWVGAKAQRRHAARAEDPCRAKGGARPSSVGGERDERPHASPRAQPRVPHARVEPPPSEKTLEGMVDQKVGLRGVCRD